MKNTTITESLKKALADTYSLYLKTQNFHWNVTGPNFNALYLLFEGQYTVTVQTKTLFQPAPRLANLTLVSFTTGVISHVLSITSQAFACTVATAG